MTISTTRAAYQHPNQNLTCKRAPIATKQTLLLLDAIEYEASMLKCSTTKAAFDIRLNRLRYLVKQL